MKKGKNSWTFKTELGVVIATFLVSFAFISMKVTGNAVANGFSQTTSFVGGVLFVLGIVEALALIASRKR